MTDDELEPVRIPHDLRAERAVLGCAFLDPEIFGWLELDARCFFSPEHRHLWLAGVAVYELGEPVDPVTVGAELDRRGYTEVVDITIVGQAAIEAQSEPTGRVTTYAKILHDRRAAREILVAVAEVTRDVARNEDSDEVLGSALRRLSEISLNRVDRTPTLGRVAEQEFRLILEPDQSDVPGLSTGFAKLDGFTSGIPIGVPTILAARPGVGKSSMALAIADHVSRHGGGVLIASYEDQPRGWSQRLMGRHSGVNINAIRNRRLNSADMADLDRAMGKIRANERLVVERCHGWTAQSVIRYARSRRRELGLSLVVIDYIQRMPPPRSGMRRDEAINETVQALADFSGSDELGLIICSQISRNVVDRDGIERAPGLADLSGSKGLEESGKLILALFEPPASEQPDVPTISYGQAPGTPLDILILKNHQGPAPLVVNAKFDKAHCRFAA